MKLLSEKEKSGVCVERNVSDCILDYLGAHVLALYTYDNRLLIAVSAIPSNRSDGHPKHRLRPTS